MHLFSESKFVFVLINSHAPMVSILLKTLIMFILSFIIAMIVALMIYWIRGLLTSVRVNSLFDEKSKTMVKRARRIHKIHDNTLNMLAGQTEHDVHPELFDFYKGVNKEFVQPEDYHGELKPVSGRRRSAVNRKKL